MTISKYLLCFSFLLSISSVLTAAHHKVEISTPTKTTLQQKLQQKLQQNLQSKKGIVKNYSSAKRLTKRYKSDDERISNGAIITILAGLLTASLLLFAIYTSFAAFGLILIATAIVSCVSGIRTLRLIRNSENPERYKVSKIMTIIGLIPFSVITASIIIGLIIALLGLWFL
ncbi:MAG: hypothetical protein AB8G11_05640 [Saprospiraceae bacterium]